MVYSVFHVCEWTVALYLILHAVAGEIRIPYKILDINGLVQNHLLSLHHSANLSEEVVRLCRDERIRAPGCRQLFSRGMVEAVRIQSPQLSGNDIIAMYTHFSVLYTSLAQDMDSVLPVPPHRYEFDSELNYYLHSDHGHAAFRTAKVVLCASHYQEDLNWLRTIQTPYIIVTKDPSARFDGYALRIEHNRGNEVSSYLRYIVEYYDSFPEFTLFLHGHNQDWHQYYPVYYIIEHLGFQKGFESINNVVVFPYDVQTDARLRSLWPILFADELGDIPETGFKDKCCAQFLVHRDRIHLRSKAFYQRLYDYLIADSQDDAAQLDGYHCTMSYVMEMVWHYIFGEPPIISYPPGTSQFDLTSTSPLGQPLNLYV
jgi:hypothetical protein